MKKTIIIELLLFFVLVLLIDIDVRYIMGAVYGYSFNILSIFFAICTFFLLAAMVLVALRDIPAMKAIIDKYKQKKKDNKAIKTAQKKQARIEKLQVELDELKKDE